jgi:phosphohistidine phosphatase SixA
MWLYVVRHGAAGRSGDPRYPDDLLRPLTRRGERRFRRLARRLAEHGVASTLIVTSPVLRCRQTAQALAAEMPGEPRLLERDELAPKGPWQDLVAWTNGQDQAEVAWVGHSSDVKRILAELIGAIDGGVTLEMGAIAAVRFAEGIAVGQGELCWIVRPRWRDGLRAVLRRLARGVGLSRAAGPPASNHPLPRGGQEA